MRLQELVEELESRMNPDLQVYVADDGGWMHELFIGEDNLDRDILTLEALPERVDGQS